MNEEQLKKYLVEKLSIQLDTQTEMGPKYYITVKVFLDGEEISSDRVQVDQE